jgi:glycosyltransferase involved in cell wall biosynthesis
VLDSVALLDAYRSALALVLPAEEDFGISPVEAMACGRPVIALRRGGTLETVVDGVTGLLVDDATPDAFADAMRRLPALPLDSETITGHAARFGVARFERDFAALVTDALTMAAAC